MVINLTITSYECLVVLVGLILDHTMHISFNSVLSVVLFLAIVINTKDTSASIFPLAVSIFIEMLSLMRQYFLLLIFILTQELASIRDLSFALFFVKF